MSLSIYTIPFRLDVNWVPLFMILRYLRGVCLAGLLDCNGIDGLRLI